MSASSVTAPLGALSPLAFVANITPGASGIDLTTVTAASVQAQRGAGSGSWACTLSNQTTNTLTVTHPYAVGDLPALGRVQVYVILTLNSGGQVLTLSISL